MRQLGQALQGYVNNTEYYIPYMNVGPSKRRPTSTHYWTGYFYDYGFLPLGEKHLTSIDLLRKEQMKMLLPQLLERVRNHNNTPDIIRTPTKLIKRDSTFF